MASEPEQRPVRYDPGMPALRRARFVLTFAAIGLAAGVAAAPAEGARPQVLGDARTVALALEVQDALIVDRVDRAALLEHVRRALETAGVEVVPLETTAEVIRSVREAARDWVDPATGKFSRPRYAAGMGEVLRHLRERAGAERLVVVVLWVTEAHVSGGVARWHGVEEPAVTPAARSAWSRLRAGKLEALSLAVNVRGEAGSLLYSEPGGVRLLSRFGRNDKITPVLDAELLDDPDRLERAVRLALAPLLGALPALAAPAAP